MRNFVRALRCCWPYRRRLALSVAAAVFAAGLWGLSISAINPVLQLLTEEKSLQDAAQDKIRDLQKRIDEWEAQRAAVSHRTKEVSALPDSPLVQKDLRDLANQSARLDRRLSWGSLTLWWSRVLHGKMTQYLPADRFQCLAWVFGLLVLGVAVKGFFEFWQESLVGSVVNLSLFDLRNRFFRNVIHLDVTDFGDQGTHELMARFTNDIEILGNGTKTLFGKVVAEPLRAMACVVLACLISWQLTLLFLVLVPIAMFTLAKIGRVMKRATRRLLQRISSIYKILQETFTGIRVVKAFTMEPYERRRFCSATKDYYHKAMWVLNLDAFAGPVVELMGAAAVSVALLAGAYLVVRQETHLGPLQMSDRPLDSIELLTFYGFLLAIADPVRKLSSVYTKIQSGAAAADRIYAYLDRQPRVRGNANAPRLSPHAGEVEFRDICFSYEPGRSVLSNVHLRVRFGETVALVGKNGCGKTTLVGLIPRFYDPDHGSVLIDGRDIRHVNLRSLRQQVGLVSQETVLFDDTVHNNIAYGSRRASPEQVEQAARRAYAHDFIAKLPEGYQTRLGEGGHKLSGGQRQRLALARAILRDPRILVLDEFTSQSDAESEALIHRALREFMSGRTTFVITHRLNTLEVADRIVVVDSGRVSAVGTHAELLATCPVYQRLHEAHFQRLCA